MKYAALFVLWDRAGVLYTDLPCILTVFLLQHYINIRPPRSRRTHSSAFLSLCTRKGRPSAPIPGPAVSLLQLWDELFLNSQSNRNRELLFHNTGTVAELWGQLAPASPLQHPHQGATSVSGGGEGHCQHHPACHHFVFSVWSRQHSVEEEMGTEWVYTSLPCHPGTCTHSQYSGGTWCEHKLKEMVM